MPILARDFHTRFPRELRDLVYSYLWDDDAMRKLNDPLLLRLASPPFNVRPDSGVPHFAQPSCVGEEVSYEAVEWLYKSTTDFKVDSENLEKFLYLDIFRFGFTPANSRIKKLTVNLELTDREVFPTLGYAPSRDAVTGPFKTLMHVDLGTDFKLVMRLKPLSMVTILAYPLIRHARQVLEYMIYALEKRGMGIEVWYGERDVRPVLGNLNDWWYSLCGAPDRASS